MYTMMMWLNVMNSLSVYVFIVDFFSWWRKKLHAFYCVCSIFIYLSYAFFFALSYYYPIPILIINSRVINLQNKVHFLNLMRNRDSLETMTKWRNVIKSVSYMVSFIVCCATNCLLFVFLVFFLVLALISQHVLLFFVLLLLLLFFFHDHEDDKWCCNLTIFFITNLFCDSISTC